MLRRIIILIGTCIMMVLFVGILPSENATGIEEYNKEKIIEEYGSDIDSALFLFPDDTEEMLESAFASNFKSGLFDTDGYLILQTKYSTEDYRVEVERLSNVSCSVMDTELSVQYDTESYALPAYVAVDGFDYVYEYALVDEENCKIVYVLISYPESVDLNDYQEYLKLNTSEYVIEDALNQFSIYAREAEDGVYVEYSDEVK